MTDGRIFRESSAPSVGPALFTTRTPIPEWCRTSSPGWLQSRISEISAAVPTMVQGPAGDALTETLYVPANVILVGGYLNIAQSMTKAIVLADGAGLVDVEIRVNENVTSRVIEAISKENIVVEGVRFTGEGDADVVYAWSTTNAKILKNRFTAGWNGIVLRESTVNAKVADNEFAGWRNRAIHVTTDNAAGTQGIKIVRNEIQPHRPATGSPKQPIAIQSTGGYHTDIRVNDNEVEGLRNHTIGASTALDGNTADQISLHRCEDFQVNGNVSRWGGELGINLSVACRKGEVIGNLVHNNDLSGISVGAIGAGAVDRCHEILVASNTAYDNGKIVEGNVSNLNSAGLWSDNSDNIFFLGNTSFDSGVGHQQYGQRIRNSTNVQRQNVYYNNVVADELED